MEIWGDEAGNLDFGATGSRYFIICTIVVDDQSLARDLLSLRQDLVRRNVAELDEGFHATKDVQAVRDEVFALLTGRAIRADATLFLKSKTLARIRARPDFIDYFCKLAWFYHHRHVLPAVVPAGVAPFIAVATLETKKRRQLHAQALREVMNQCLGRRPHTCAHWTAASHPCLQAADYYTWAVQRWFEGKDSRSWNLVQNQFQTTYKIWE
jgi:hypothetical protein